MKLREFRKSMKNNIFSWAEARVVAFGTDPRVLKLQLHAWRKAGDIVSLKRGVYAFAGARSSMAEVARALYSPCYISLEYALNYYGLIPDLPFGVTLVTTKKTRKFNTVFGQFSYQKIKKKAFSSFDPETLLAGREKALVDYLYLNQNKLVADCGFWKEMRWQNLKTVHFGKAAKLAKQFGSKKLDILLKSLKEYAKLI